MTKPVSSQQDIRLLDAKGVPWREITRRLGVSAGDRQEVRTDGGLFAETGLASGAPRPGAGWRRSWNSRAACRRTGRSSPTAWRRRPRRRWRSWRHGCARRPRPAGARNARACCDRPGSPNPRNSTGTTGHRSASRSTAGASRSSRSNSPGGTRTWSCSGLPARARLYFVKSAFRVGPGFPPQSQRTTST